MKRKRIEREKPHRFVWGPPPFQPGDRIKGKLGRRIWIVLHCRKRRSTDRWPYKWGWDVVFKGTLIPLVVVAAESLELLGWRPAAPRTRKV